jgi:hypothetical protein
MKKTLLLLSLIYAGFSFSQKYSKFPKGKTMYGADYTNYVQPSYYSGEFVSDNGSSVMLKPDGTGYLFLQRFTGSDYAGCRCCSSNNSIVWGVAYDGNDFIEVLCDINSDSDSWQVQFDNNKKIVAISKIFYDSGKVTFKRKY